MKDKMLTRREYIAIVTKTPDDDASLKKGIEAGFLESEDILFKDSLIEKRNAARIVHEYIKRVKGIPDFDEYGACRALKDLYDCHVCTNHIAQVYDRGLIKGKSDKVFGLTDKVSYEDATQTARKIGLLCGADSLC